MADGKTHTRANLILAGATIPAGFINPLALFVSAGIAASAIIGPDLDVDDGNISNYYMRKLGLDILWRFIVYPYRVSFKHRGISHWPLVGTITRILYFIVPLPVILLSSDQNGKRIKAILVAAILQLVFLFLWFLVWPFISGMILVVPLFCLGLFLGDCTHILLDSL